MSIKTTFSGFMLLILAAFLGLALIYLPNWIVGNYSRAAALGSLWGTLYLVVVGLGALLFLGSAIYTIWKLWGRSLAKRSRRLRRNLNPSELSASQKRAEIDENLGQIEQLASSDDPELRAELDPLLEELESKRESQTLEIVAFGTISSGKSSVLNLLAGQEVFDTDVRGGTTVTRNEIPWPGIDKVTLVDTPGLGEVDGADHVSIAADSAQDSDLILVVVDGPLRDSEFDLLTQLGAMEKRIIICLNKSDWYSDEDQQKLTTQIFSQTDDFIQQEDIVCIQAQPGFRLRRKIKADGTEVEQKVIVEPEIEPLADRMMEILSRDGKELLMANLLLQSRGLVEKARDKVQTSLDRRARDIVEKYMWGAGGVAAISPFPVVDLLAGTAISTKMILELAAVYQQDVDLQTAQKWLSEMGKNLVSVLGATGAAAVLASLIKSVPIAGTIAGGVAQGAIQAIVTRWIGAVFIEYFQNEMQTPEGGLAGLARRKWELLTTADELRKLVQTARSKLSG